MISGFTYCHNPVRVGIPIKESIQAVRPYVDEMVVVDAESNDGTKEWLKASGMVDKVIDAKWGTDAGETLKRLHGMNVECSGDVIIHFEADEVYDDELLKNIIDQLHFTGRPNYQVQRLQVEQNFQRVRWYPEYVHRVFMKGTVSKKGHTTEEQTAHCYEMPGFLWDVTNCFRDQWLARVDQQSELWNGVKKYLMVPLHCSQPVELTRDEATERLKEEHWTWGKTPLDIPDILRPLVGQTKYKL